MNLILIFMDPCIVVWLSRNTNKMQPCNRIYYSTVHWRLNMFRGAHRSSSGALTVFAASGLHMHVVFGRSQVWVGTQFPLRLDYGLSASLITPSIHLRFGLPTRLLPFGLSKVIFLHGRLSCIHTICPAHLSLVILTVVTKSVSSYRWSLCCPFTDI
jgi:hypothetical protein